MKRLMTVALSSAVAAAAHAQGVAVKGPGTFSCGEYLELRTKHNQNQDKVTTAWVWGYMAGFNLESKYPTKPNLPDQPSTLSYIDKHCRESPLDSVLQASYAHIKALGGRSSN